MHPKKELIRAGLRALRRFWTVRWFALICMALLISACGGSGGGGVGTGGQGSFTISLSSSSVTVDPSGAQKLTVTLNPQNGFGGSPGCQVSVLPNGVSVAPNFFYLSSGTPQTISLNINNLAVSGTSTVTISCSSGAVSATGNFTLVINSPPGVTLTLNPTSLNMEPGTTANVSMEVSGTGGVNGTLNGTITNLPAGVTSAYPTFATAANATEILSFTASSTATLSGTAHISVTNGTVSASADLPITVNTGPDFSLSTGIFTGTGIAEGSSETISVTATAYNGFNSPIAVSMSGNAAGVTFTPSSFQLQPGKGQAVKIDASFSAVVGTYTITATGNGGGLTRTTQFSLTISAPTVSIGAQPSPLTVPAGSQTEMFVQVSGTTGGTQPISVQFGTPPAGITIVPSSFTTAGQGAEQVVYVQAASNAQPGNITATATYGPATAHMNVPVTIGAAEKYPSVPLSTFEQLVHADALTPYTSFPAPNYLIYHQPTNQFFSTDAYLNQLNVTDAATRKLKTTIVIPGAFGIDQAADGSVIYVGTEIGDLYVVDPVKLTILKRYPTEAISAYGFPANAVYALASGKLLLERYFMVPGYSWIDGNGPLALWDPATNNITVFTFTPDGLMPEKPTCLQGFENAILTNNRTRIMLSAILTSEGSSLLCSLDPEKDTWNWSPQLTGGDLSSLTVFAASPDGNVLVAFDGFKVYNLDPATLAVKNSFSVPKNLINLEYPPMFLSLDNSKVFIDDVNGAGVFDEYDLKTGTMTGWIPSINLPAEGSYTPALPYYQAMTPAGVAAGVIPGGGIGLLDTTAVRPLPVGTYFATTQLQTTVGPASGGTATSWLPSPVGIPTPPLGSIYFGANAATDLNSNGFDGFLEAVTPAGSPGPVDVRTFATDGGVQYIPFGFSYGPTILETTTNYATAEGGGPASLYGLGFGSVEPVSNTGYTVPPSDLQVTVGGKTATVNAYNADPYGSIYFTSAPIPSTSLIYTVPAGVAGGSVPVVVTNHSGSTTASTQLTYLPAVKQFSVPGQLADGVYDPKRDVYYFTDANQVRVFSATQEAWLAPIPIPAPQGAYGPQRLFGISISPDASKLAVTDPGAAAIYLINPDQPSAILTFTYAAQNWDPVLETPTGPAVTNNGTVYFATADFNGDGASGYLVMLDPSTGKFTLPGGSIATEGPYTAGRVALTADGARAYTNDLGWVGYLDVASGEFNYMPVALGVLSFLDYEVVLGANQTSVFGAGIFMDSNLNAHGLQALNVAESIDAEYTYGAALSTDGSLLFQPGVQYIDVFNGYNGAFIGRISLPMPLSPNFRALVSNGRDSKLVAITGTGDGIAVIDLNSFPEPNPVSYLPTPAVSARPHATHLAGGRNKAAAGESSRSFRRRESPILQSLAAARKMRPAPGPAR